MKLYRASIEQGQVVDITAAGDYVRVQESTHPLILEDFEGNMRLVAHQGQAFRVTPFTGVRLTFPDPQDLGEVPVRRTGVAVPPSVGPLALSAAKNATTNAGVVASDGAVFWVEADHSPGVEIGRLSVTGEVEFFQISRPSGAGNATDILIAGDNLLLPWRDGPLQILDGQNLDVIGSIPYGEYSDANWRWDAVTVGNSIWLINYDGGRYAEEWAFADGSFRRAQQLTLPTHEQTHNPELVVSDSGVYAYGLGRVFSLGDAGPQLIWEVPQGAAFRQASAGHGRIVVIFSEGDTWFADVSADGGVSWDRISLEFAVYGEIDLMPHATGWMAAGYLDDGNKYPDALVCYSKDMSESVPLWLSGHEFYESSDNDFFAIRHHVNSSKIIFIAYSQTERKYRDIYSISPATFNADMGSSGGQPLDVRATLLIGSGMFWDERITGTVNAVVTSQPAARVIEMPPVEVSSLPAVAVESMPPLEIEYMPAVKVSSLPAVAVESMPLVEVKPALLLDDSGTRAVTDTATEILPAASARRAVFVRNTGAEPVALGGAAVTLETAAIVLEQGESYALDVGAGAAWYAVAATEGELALLVASA